MKLKRQSLVSQGSLVRILQAAEEAWKQKDFQKNIELLERASRLAPANSDILLQLGRMHGLRFNYAAAEQCFEKAVRIASRKTEILGKAALHSRDFRNQELAIRYFQRAVEQNDVKAENLIKLAELYERLRRPEEASELVERALQLDGVCPSALLARARLNRQSGKLEESEKILRSLVTEAGRTKSDPETHVRSWYELGAILDRQGRYDEAMTAFLGAKTLLRPSAAPFAVGLKSIHERLKEMRENITGEMLHRWFDSGCNLQKSRRLALLCGHPRSGTTLLEQVLDSHPDVVSAEETEIFHDEAYVPLARNVPEGTRMIPVLEAVQTEALLRARADYFHFMELSLGQSLGERLLIDKNPSLTFLIPAIVRVFPEIKLLVALRDPRDVCLSCFMQPFFPLGQTNSAYLTLEGTIEEYMSLMNVWLTLKPLLKNQSLEVRYEEMVNDLESVARRTLDFLDVPWNKVVLGFDQHAREKAVRSPTYADVTKPVFKTAVGRWHHYQKHLKPHLAKLEPFIKAFGYE